MRCAEELSLPSPPQQTAAIGTADANARQAIDEVYRLASAANSVGQLELAMQRCSQLQQQPLSADNAQYLSQLQAWLLNRRGEAYATAAGRAMEANQETEAVGLEQQAIVDFNASIEFNPHWRAFHNRGVSLAMLGKYDEAIASFAESIDLNPSYANSRFNRAELWLELGRYDLAEQDYGEVLRLEPQDVDARLGRGHARFYLTRFEEALADFDAAIQQQPDHAVAHADRADLYAFLGRWKEAAQDYRAAIQLDRGLGRAYQSAAWLMATCPDERFRDAELALRSAERTGTGRYERLPLLGHSGRCSGQRPTVCHGRPIGGASPAIGACRYAT